MCDDLIAEGESRRCTEYPIEIYFCDRCVTAHQRYQVPKRDLFPASYHYRSRFTADVLNGMKGLVENCIARHGSIEGKTVLDVGCNDGSLLGFFREQGAKTLGIEPTGAFEDAAERGHCVYNAFLDVETARRVVQENGHPKFIVFTNVFAHIENLPEVLNALRVLMDDDTVLIVENHYLGGVLKGNQFDTFYHEHPRTYSCTSFFEIAKSLGLQLTDVSFPARYGGNIRVEIAKSGAGLDHSIVKQVLADESRFGALIREMQPKIDLWKIRTRSKIEKLAKQYGKIYAKAFPGRAAILIKLLELDHELVAEVFEKPGSLKIGHYLPGTRIPIRSDDDLFAKETKPDLILNLAWHIPKEIRDYLTGHGYQGQVVDILSPQDFKAA